MLGQSLRIPIITLLAVLLLVAACTASQAAPPAWSLSWGFDIHGDFYIIIDFHYTGSLLAVKGFQFDLQSDPTKVEYTGLELLSPFGLNPPSSNPDIGAGLFRVSGAAPDGTFAPANEVNLAHFTFRVKDATGVLPEFTVSSGPNGYALLSDGTTLGPGEIASASGVPEPGSATALGASGIVTGLLALRRRRR